MRHYEVAHGPPDQSEQAGYIYAKALIEGDNGKIHRLKISRRQLAYPIENLSGAHYCSARTSSVAHVLTELGDSLPNDAVLRHIVLSRPSADLEPSLILKSKDDRPPSSR
jgi:small subunit ribosomal protein S6